LRERSHWEEQAFLQEARVIARNASKALVQREAEAREEWQLKRAVRSQLKDLQIIAESEDRAWQKLMTTCVDKRHFFQAAFQKLGKDA